MTSVRVIRGCSSTVRSVNWDFVLKDRSFVLIHRHFGDFGGLLCIQSDLEVDVSEALWV